MAAMEFHCMFYYTIENKLRATGLFIIGDVGSLT